MRTPGYLLGRALARFFDAIFGVFLLIGPFVLFLYRGFSLALVITFLLVAAGYGYVLWNYRASGLSYLREIACDTLTAIAAALGAAGASIVLARFAHLRLPARALLVPAVIVGAFWYLEYRAAKRRAPSRKATWLGRAEEVAAVKQAAESPALSLHPAWSAPAELPAPPAKP